MSVTNRRKMGNKNDERSQRIKSYKNTRHGTPEGTRTPDLLIRSQSLYPTELLAHTPHRRLSIIAQPVQKSKLFFRVPGNSSEADQTVFTGPFGCDMIIQKPADAGHGTG